MKRSVSKVSLLLLFLIKCGVEEILCEVDEMKGCELLYDESEKGEGPPPTLRDEADSVLDHWSAWNEPWYDYCYTHRDTYNPIYIMKESIKENV